MPNYPILNAIAQKDWSTATTAVNAALQQKVAQHLAQERVQVGQTLVKEGFFDRLSTAAALMKNVSAEQLAKAEQIACHFPPQMVAAALKLDYDKHKEGIDIFIRNSKKKYGQTVKEGFIIVKSSRDSDTPYAGPACQSAGVPPGKRYDSESEAKADAKKLSQHNPVGFEVISEATTARMEALARAIKAGWHIVIQEVDMVCLSRRGEYAEIDNAGNFKIVPNRIQPGDNVRTIKGGQTRGVVTKVEDGQVFFQIDDPYAKYGPRVLKTSMSNVIKEESLPITDVQRIFDETGNIAETEELCNITKLIVNTAGEVVSYVQPDPIKESLMNEGLYGLTRMQIQHTFDRFMSTGYGLNQAIRNTERECGVTGLQLSSDGKTVAYYHEPGMPRTESKERV